MNRIKTEVKEVSVLLRSIPSLTMTLFIVSVITMNLLANKSINLPFSFMALDCGIVVWMSSQNILVLKLQHKHHL